MKKVILLANDTTYVYNLRKEVILQLVEEGYEVVVVSRLLLLQDELRGIGCRLVDLDTGRHGKNPLDDLKLFVKYVQLLRREKPDVVLTYNIKPNIYGGMACRLLGLRYFPNITGLGTAVEYPGKLQMLTTRLYKWGVAGAECVFFQNEENRKFFQDRKMLSSESRTCLLPGSGVSLNAHPVLEYPKDEQVNFLFVARVMKEKGIELYLEAAKIISSKYPNTLFHVCGQCDDDKYFSVLTEAEKQGYVVYHGQQKYMQTFFKMANCVVHPTYYPEGMSNVLLESAASGRPIITTDRSGCREIVEDGVNGFVCKQQDSEDLIRQIEKFLALSWEQRRDMGLAGRAKVEREYDRQLVVQAYLEELEKSTSI